MSSDVSADHPSVDRKLLEILVCPVTRGALIFDSENQELISVTAKLAYPIRNGVPAMLQDEARKLTDEETARWRGRVSASANTAMMDGGRILSAPTEN